MPIIILLYIYYSIMILLIYLDMIELEEVNKLLLEINELEQQKGANKSDVNN